MPHESCKGTIEGPISRTARIISSSIALRLPSLLQHCEDGLAENVLLQDVAEVFEEDAPLFGGIRESVEPKKSLTERAVCALLL